MHRFFVSQLIPYSMKSGYIVAKDELPDYEQIQAWPGFVIEIVDSELDLLNALVDLVQGFDPDVIMSYEIQSNSIGYIQERAVTKFGKSPQDLTSNAYDRF